MGKFSTIQAALAALKKGKIIILVDDIHRENEGDFVMAAQFANEATINLMITRGKGLVCAPISEQISTALDLPLMVQTNTESFRTAFTVSIDAKTNTTGISAKERADTLNKLADPNAKPHDFVRPGHLFPLIGKTGGLHVRQGHTEASLTLMKLAGLMPVSVICEIILDNGKMARRDDLFILAEQLQMPIIEISQLMNLKEDRS
jgi:3,4-dihydroxy 2-butanone 4-phosphate synthase / GTP cyclohydrolase II